MNFILFVFNGTVLYCLGASLNKTVSGRIGWERETEQLLFPFQARYFWIAIVLKIQTQTRLETF